MNGMYNQVFFSFCILIVNFHFLHLCRLVEKKIYASLKCRGHYTISFYAAAAAASSLTLSLGHITFFFLSLSFCE